MKIESEINQKITAVENYNSPRFASLKNDQKNFQTQDENELISKLKIFQKFNKLSASQEREFSLKIHTNSIQILKKDLSPGLIQNEKYKIEHSLQFNVHNIKKLIKKGNIKNTNLPCYQRQNGQAFGCRKKSEKNTICENHLNEKAQFYLELQEENQKDRILYCQSCACNLWEQGFQVNVLQNINGNGNAQKSKFLVSLNEKIKNISLTLEELSDEKFHKVIEQKKNEIQYKFDKIIQNLTKIKRSEFLKLQKLKFELFEQKIAKQNYFDSFLKKIQLIKACYQKNMLSKQMDYKFYENLIQRQDKSFEEETIGLSCQEFLSLRQICQKLRQKCQNH